MNIAFFDFDGTLTRKDSFLPFMKSVSSKRKYYSGLVLIALLYFQNTFNIISGKKLKEKVLTFFIGGLRPADIHEEVVRFTEKLIPGLLTGRAVGQLNSHRSKGDKIVIVSASMDIWLEHWCQINSFDLICSVAEIKNGMYTGKLEGKNCKGKEKVKRIKESYDLTAFERIYAYGDSTHDLPMLALGTDSYYNWKLMK